MMEKARDIISAIVKAWKIGHPMHYPLSGTILSVSQNSCKVKVRNEVKHDVTWFFKGKPLVGSKCVIISRDNSPEKYTLVEVDEYDEIEFKASKIHSVKMNQTEILVSHNNGAITWKFDSLGVELDLKGKKFTIKNGNIEQTLGDIKTTGNVKAKQEVTAFEGTPGSVGLSSHLTDYTDSPIGPSVSGPPKGGT